MVKGKTQVLPGGKVGEVLKHASQKSNSNSLQWFRRVCLILKSSVIKSKKVSCDEISSSNDTESVDYQQLLSRCNSNDSTNDYDMFRRKYIRKARTVLNGERDNNLDDWNVAQQLRDACNDFSCLLITKEEKLIRGNGYTLELPKGMTEVDKQTVINTRYNRRHAVHIDKTKELNDMLRSYVALKHFNCLVNIISQ